MMPSHEIVRADSLFELIVWLIIAVIWMIAQGLARSKRRAPPPAHGPSAPPPVSEPEDIDEFFDLLRKQFEVSETVSAPPAPPPIPKQPKRRLKRRVEVTETRKPESEPEQAIPRSVPEQVTAPPSAVPDFPPVPGLEVSRHTRKASLLTLAGGFSSRKTKLPSFRLFLRYPRTPAVSVGEMLRGRKNLQKAIILQTILGPPRALRPWMPPPYH